MDADQLAGAVRDALAVRDRARRGQLFRPDRALNADVKFLLAVRALVWPLQEALIEREAELEALRAELAAARAAAPATMAPERARTAPAPRKARSANQGTPATPKPAQRRTAPRREGL